MFDYLVEFSSRGFRDFANWVESEEGQNEFPFLSCKLPVMRKDETGRYTTEESDKSRTEVTKIRHVVENAHAAQKTFRYFKHAHDLSEFEKHFLKNHRFINACLNRFGFARRTQTESRAFTSEYPGYELITDNPFIVKTNLSEVICISSHEMNWKRRNNSVWKELTYNDPRLLGLFTMVDDQLLGDLTGGSFALRTARAYQEGQLAYLQKRTEELNRRDPDLEAERSVVTYNTEQLNRSFRFRVEKLREPVRLQHFPQLDHVIRMDICSKMSKWKRYKTFVGIQLSDDRCRYSFGCTCSTGNRSTPCVHGILFLYLFGQIIPNLD